MISFLKNASLKYLSNYYNCICNQKFIVYNLIKFKNSYIARTRIPNLFFFILTIFPFFFLSSLLIRPRLY